MSSNCARTGGETEPGERVDFLHPEALRARLEGLEREPRRTFSESLSLTEQEEERLRDAAVLIPLVERAPGQMSVLLTKRSAALRKHSGEFSFPGGRRDDEDADLMQTALREAQEEVALEPDAVRVFGALMKMPTVTGFMVTSYVGEFEPSARLVGNPDEIDLLLEVPMSALLDPGVHRTQPREWRGESFVMHIFAWQGHVIWGATAYMLYDLVQYLRGR